MMSDDWYRDSSASDKSQKTLKSTRKRPSTGISSIMETKIEPLFTFPEQLLVCKRPKPREETSVIRKRRIKDFYDNSYTGNRLRREKFRRFMVGLIVKPEGFHDVRDKDVNRYYNYVRNGVDTIHVANMGENDVEKILSLVPSDFRERFQDFTKELLEQIREDYVGAIKQSIVDFVLSDPFQEDISQKETLKLSPENFISPSDFNSYQNQLKKYLFPINPCMRLTLEHWIRDWKSFRLIDLTALEANNESWNLMDFKSTIFNQISNGRKILKTKWFDNIQSIFLVVSSGGEQNLLETSCI
ncbi:dynein axonemal heavy chain 7-like [Diachasmimorpha longicaudata]|uniref:dynein axonemal heavy chain 7-like n=1 Tax=Diachasmimorpha longicaudata TaxID=58733 RepID=UPI0030B91C3D